MFYQLHQEPTSWDPETTPEDWSKLENKYLYRIVRHLEDDPLAVACKRWGSASKTHRKTCKCPPKLTLIPGLMFPSLQLYHLPPHQAIHNITNLPQLNNDRTVNLFHGSSDGFLVFTNHANLHDMNVNVQAINPITGAHFLFPPPSSLPEYQIFGSRTNITKAVITVSRSRLPTVVVYYMGRCKLAFAMHGDGSWMVLSTVSPIQDFLFHKGRLCALTPTGELFAYDLDWPLDPTVSLAHPVLLDGELLGKMYLVESPDRGGLFFVRSNLSFLEKIRQLGILVFLFFDLMRVR